MAKRMLVIYYTYSNGNTERIADQLARECGADTAQIETVEPYPDDYQETVDQGKREVDEGCQPPIEELDVDLANYDVVAVGTPTWWYTMAPAVSTFLATADLKGKTVVPFMTCAGWNGTVIDDMEDAIDAAGGKAACPLEVTFDSTGGSRLVSKKADIERWAQNVRSLLG